MRKGRAVCGSALPILETPRVRCRRAIHCALPAGKGAMNCALTTSVQQCLSGTDRSQHPLRRRTRRMLPSAANPRQPKAHLHPAIMIDDSDDLSEEDAEGTGGDSVLELEATPEPGGEGGAPRRWVGIALAVLLLFSFGLRAWDSSQGLNAKRYYDERFPLKNVSGILLHGELR